MSTLKYTIYNSRYLSPPFEEVDLDICREARSFNAEHDITGFLLRSAGYYYQYLEGPHDVIDSLMASIARDARHTDFCVLQSGETQARRFKDWCMGYVNGVEDELTPVLPPLGGGEEVADILCSEASKQDKTE